MMLATTQSVSLQPSIAARLYNSPLFAASLSFAVFVTIDVAAYTYGGTPLFTVLTLASAGAWGAALVATRRAPSSRPVAFDLYVAALASLVVMYGEQWAGDWSARLASCFPPSYPEGVGISNHAFVAVFPLAGSALLLLGALAYYHGNPIGRFAASFTFLWGILAPLSTYVMPVFGSTSCHLLPGAVTAPLPLIVSWLGWRRLMAQVARPAR